MNRLVHAWLDDHNVVPPWLASLGDVVAKYTSHANTLYPMYEVQLNVYAFLGDHFGLTPIAGVALVYNE